MRAIKAPHREGFAGTGVRLFLAGSIDQGAARDWQAEICERLADLDLWVYNPRREGWDSTWEMSIHNDQFREQVEWELDHLDGSHVIALVFDENGKAPISLLELGLYAGSGKIVCFCPTEYWRSGNVQIVCDRYDIPLYENDFDGFVEHLRDRIQDEALKLKSRERVVVYEGSPGNIPDGAIDGSEEFLRPEDRFTPEERARPRLAWLNQGPESRRKHIDVERRRNALTNEAAVKTHNEDRRE